MTPYVSVSTECTTTINCIYTDPNNSNNTNDYCSTVSNKKELPENHSISSKRQITGQNDRHIIINELEFQHI